MLIPGLVSITFRQLSPEEIVDMVGTAGLNAIEWGGDVHVPHGNLARAQRIRKITERAGLRVASYGSYYRVGHEEDLAFTDVLETASVLHAPSIRVWAGKKNRSEADAEYVDLLISETRRIAELAADKGITVAYEFHRGTLTETNSSARQLLETVAHDNIKSLWQPPIAATKEYCLEGLDAVSPWLTDIHVFHWAEDPDIRLSLEEGKAVWPCYLEKIASTGRDHFLMIEFVRKDEPDNFLKDAKTLKTWLSKFTLTADTN
ncbi:MAG: TIM barrel protein [Planctomycetota bacterium]